jgi:hypothetical protein
MGFASGGWYALAARELSADGNNNKRTAEKKKPEEARPEANVVRVLREQVEQKLTKEGVNASLGDYIRLVQLQKELEEEQPREIKVTWVEPEGTEESDSGE